MELKGERLPTRATAARMALRRAIRPAGEGFGRHTYDYHSITGWCPTPVLRCGAVVLR